MILVYWEYDRAVVEPFGAVDPVAAPVVVETVVEGQVEDVAVDLEQRALAAVAVGQEARQGVDFDRKAAFAVELGRQELAVVQHLNPLEEAVVGVAAADQQVAVVVAAVQHSN